MIPIFPIFVKSGLSTDFEEKFTWLFKERTLEKTSTMCNNKILTLISTGGGAIRPPSPPPGFFK